MNIAVVLDIQVIDDPAAATVALGLCGAELTEAITTLVAKYHDDSAPSGRAHRLVVVSHPLSQKSNPKELS